MDDFMENRTNSVTKGVRVSINSVVCVTYFMNSL